MFWQSGCEVRDSERRHKGDNLPTLARLLFLWNLQWWLAQTWTVYSMSWFTDLLVNLPIADSCMQCDVSLTLTLTNKRAVMPVI